MPRRWSVGEVPQPAEIGASIDAGPSDDLGENDKPHETRPGLLGVGPLSMGLRWYGPPRRKYTLRELLADRIINFGGAGLSWVGTPVLAYASWAANDSFAKQAGFCAFGFGLITMLTCSAFYHLLCWRWDISQELLGLDHVGISSMIMGAYVPVMQMVGAWTTLAVVLSLGLLGWIIEAYKFFCAKQDLNAKSGLNVLDKLQVVRYMVMGWACLAVAPSLLRRLPAGAAVFYIAAGLLFSFGVPVWIRHKMEYHMPAWHFAVVAASLCVWCANLQLVGLPLPG